MLSVYYRYWPALLARKLKGATLSVNDYAAVGALVSHCSNNALAGG